MSKQEYKQVEPAAHDLRRQRLRVALKLLLSIGAFAVLYVLFSSFLTTQPGERAYQSKRVDASSLQPGEMDLFNWNGRPVLILRRTNFQVQSLREDSEGLRDVHSKKSSQPAFASNAHRSSNPEWFVAIAAGTDLGCAISWLPASAEKFADQPWQGGFTDTCRGSRYDAAGRVFAGQRATKNLPIPDYLVSEDGIVNLGVVQ